MIRETVNYTVHDFRIKTRSVSSYTMSTHHFHDAYELYYLNAGSRDYFINDTTYPVNQGNLVLIKPSDLHKTMDTGERHSRVLISFKPTFMPLKQFQNVIDQCFESSKVIKFDYVMQDKVESLIRQMVIEAEEKKTAFEAKLQCQLSTLLIEVARYIEECTEEQDSETTANGKVYDIIQYLKSNYHNAITLEGLSEEFFISRYYLTRVFKKTTGFTIFEYIHSLRIIEAQRLLKETDLKIIDIAQKVGFSNVSNFGKVFRSITEMSPMTYRKNHRIK